MNKNLLAGTLMMVGLALPARAALIFTNVTQVPNLTNIVLNAVAYDAAGTFVAVGENSTVLTARFGTNLLWAASGVPNALVSLRSVTAYASNQFAVGGGAANALVFTNTEAGGWFRTPGDPVEPPGAYVQGLAFNPNASRFAAAASFVSINYANNTLASWINAALNGSVLIESFRGVTTLPGNGFAACGLRGDIRISLDGAATWNVSRAFNGSEPDLFGIASGGGQQLMSVGGAGRVMVSTDGGDSWLINAAPIGNINNAVAFTGDEYIVVGDGGRILTGTNAVASNWTTNATFSGSLRGVAFATSGLMEGVAMVVGDAGAVILGGTLPLAPSTPIHQTICAGSPNLPLSVTITTDPNHPSLSQTVDWYSVPTGGVVLANGSSSTSYTPSDALPGSPNAPSNYVYYAQQRDLRTGFVSPARTPVTLTINPRPASVVSGTATICNGDATVIQAALTGIGPWTVTWSDGSVSNAVASPATKTVSPTAPNPNAAASTTYTVTALTDANCTATAGDQAGSAVITVNPRPASVVSGTATICNGDATVIQAALTGIGPWTVTWSDGSVSNAVASPATKTVSPTAPNPNAAASTTYTVTALTDAHCTATAGDRTGSAVITINPRPASVVSGNATICNGDATVIQAVLTGIGPWTVTWSDGSVSNAVASPATKTVSPTAPNPNAAASTTYTVTALTDAHCTANAGDRIGSAVITVNPRPASVVSGTATICNGDATVIQAVLTGIGPWTVTWSDGSVSNAVASPATKTVSPTAPNPNAAASTTYTVTALTDAHCTATAGDRIGSAVITVNPRPASVVSGTATICNGDATVIQAVLTGIGPWTVTWSDGSVSNAVASPATKTVSPTAPNPNAAASTTYTVTALTDAHCTATAGDRTGSAVITVNPRPASVVSGTATICNGDATVIQAVLTGIGPWTVTWSDGSVSNAVASPATKTVSPTAPNPNAAASTTYTVTGLTDAHCTATAGDRTGSAVITVNPRPASVVSGTATICNGDPTVIQALLTGIGPWTVTWSDGSVSNVVASPATKTVSPAASTTYTVTGLTDAHCTATAGDRTGSAVITVNPRPATPVSLGDQIVCYGDTNLPSLKVSVAANVTANWFSTALGGSAIATGTTNLVLTQTNLIGTYDYYAEASNAITGCLSAGRAKVTLSVISCPTISRLNSTNVLVEWYGALSLLGATNLNPPVTWVLLTNSSPGWTNRWTNSIIPPPTNTFFRLTNSP